MVSVNVFAALVVPILVLGKVALVGVNVASAMPVPESAIPCGLPGALSVKLSVPDAEPSCVGVKATLTLHDLEARSEAPQVVEEMAKPGLAAMPLMFNVAVPVFFRITVLATLVLLTASLAKLSEAGSNSSVIACVTVSVSPVVCARLPEAPVKSTAAVPVVAVPLAVRVSVLVLLAGFGLKAAVTPVGNPRAESDTLPLNPFAGAIVIVLVP